MIFKNLIIDFDETIVNTNEAVLQLYREMTGDYSTDLSLIHSWWYDSVVPLWNRQQQDDMFRNPRLFELMTPKENAIEILQKLTNEGRKITICTVHQPEGIPYKAKWIKEHLPFIHNTIYIDSGGKMDKSLITGDLILDDNLNNLESSRCRHKLCFGTTGYNKEWIGHRVEDWNEFYDFLMYLEGKIKSDRS